MEDAAPLEIEKDLCRWTQKKWVVVVLLILVIQCLIVIKGSKSLAIASLERRAKPLIKFATSAAPSELVQLQDPTLFASANPRGFSGTAWIIKPPWTAPTPAGLPPRSFLERPSIRDMSSGAATAPSPAVRVTPLAPEPQPGSVATGAQRLINPSQFSVEGVENRPVVKAPPLPVQYASDALRPSIVQVLVDSDGSVFSARLLGSSGYKPADTDALRLARQLRFTPKTGTRDAGEIVTGKVTFEWLAADPSRTNEAGHNPSRSRAHAP